MQVSAPNARLSAPAINWLATAATYVFALSTIAAFALLGVEESRLLLIG